MFKKVKLSLLGGMMFASLFGGIVGATIPTGQAAAACDNAILGIPPWYKNMTEGTGKDCKIKSPPKTDEGLTKYIWTIALNVVEIILRIVAYAAVIYIIYGGFLYITSSGNAEMVSRALKTIMNAAIGFAIALSAVALKNFVWQLVVAGSNEFGIPEQSGSDILFKALNLAYFIAGALAVIMVVIGGLNYVLSSGDTSKVVKAKNTILYAVIGIAVIVFAFAITTFISKSF